MLHCSCPYALIWHHEQSRVDSAVCQLQTACTRPDVVPVNTAQDAKQGVRNLLSRHSLLAELQAKGVLNIIPQVEHPSTSRQDLPQIAVTICITFGLQGLMTHVWNVVQLWGALGVQLKKTPFGCCHRRLWTSSQPAGAVRHFNMSAWLNLLLTCPQEVKDIFHLLEADFNPLELCAKLAPLLEKLPGLGAQLSPAAPVQTADLALYAPALQRVAITKMLQQLSQVWLLGGMQIAEISGKGRACGHHQHATAAAPGAACTLALLHGAACALQNLANLSAHSVPYEILDTTTARKMA